MNLHPFRLREIPVAALTGSILWALTMHPAAALDDAGSVQNPTTLNKVSVTAQAMTSKVPTQAEQFRSAQTRKIIDGKQLQSVSAGAGAAQALEVAPGVHVNGYGSGSTTRYSISINGIKQGWGGEPSGAGIDYGSIGVTFDGIPMNNPGTGLWQTTLVNQLLLIEGIGVTYGPG
ncbi:MAG: Plug domain-containing protein, partial [Xanthomonadaceae bacterium]|nr:Plug domain-containing protein [Xanthomonadaceae bacterium]